MNTLPTHTRRAFLGAALPLAAGLAGAAEPAPDILDAHTHFYDPRRPEGVPWPDRKDTLLYRPVLPDEFRRLTMKHGVTGTVVVEASPWVEDNQWLLDLAARDKVIVGIVGRLDPANDKFPTLLERFVKAPPFRGLRIGQAELRKGLEDKQFMKHLRLLVKHDRTLDVNGGPELPLDVGKLAKELPGLRIVINHAANLPLDGKPVPAAWLKGMRAAALGKNVFCKVSALVEATGRTKGDAPTELDFYKPVLDALWETFGEERLIYGSNWPVSERSASYARLLAIVRAYFESKGARSAARFFRGNAERAYGVAKRAE